MLRSHAGTPSTDMFSGVQSPRFVPEILMGMRARIQTYSGNHVRRQYSVLRHVGSPARYTILSEPFGGGSRDCRCEGIWWHSLQNVLRARQRAWAVSDGLRFEPRDASLGQLIELRSEGLARLGMVGFFTADPLFARCASTFELAQSHAPSCRILANHLPVISRTTCGPRSHAPGRRDTQPCCGR